VAADLNLATGAMNSPLASRLAVTSNTVLRVLPTEAIVTQTTSFLQ